ALRVIEEEGLPARIQRHQKAGAALVERLSPMGFKPLVAAPHRLPMLTTLRLPESLNPQTEAALRRRLLDHHNIEVGGGLGNLAGQVWRVGLMGQNAHLESVDRLVGALEAEM
ncbi:alanine--glyoxylate aminotransferase family protein, partial [Myxococcota bacterium]|nr:alanine--glyoxylate aminotransferase family protein [Myxococcota bacterium]